MDHSQKPARRGQDAQSLPPLSFRRLAVATAATIAALVALAEWFPGDLGLLTVALAFAIGIGFERYRRSHQPLPPAFHDTPAAWWHVLREEVGLRYAGAAVLLAAAAVTVLLISLEGAGEQPRVTGPTAADAGATPQVQVRSEAVGVPFTVQGATFTVTPEPAAAWARELARRDPGRGLRWLAIAVEAENDDRQRLDPTRLSFRLRGPQQALHHPDQRGAIGPRSLTELATLRPGEGAEVRLGFRIPADAGQLVLAFEPRENGSLQVRVPLGVI